MARQQEHHASDHADTVAALRNASETTLLRRALMFFAQPLHDVVYLALLDSMASIGAARDRALCPGCGGRANPLGASNVCRECTAKRAAASNKRQRAVKREGQT